MINTIIDAELPANIQKLNQDIMHFPMITPINPKMHKTTFKGVSRTVMLDRYAFKDIKLVTLGVGDLVVLTYKDDPKFPRRGYGEVIAIDNSQEEVTVQLDSQFEDGALITVAFNKVDKPLEIFYEQIADRVARGLASAETPEKFSEVKEMFYEILANKTFVPAGRVLAGAGTGASTTFFNCYVMPHIHDSRDGIGEHRKKVMEIMSRGGGVGTNGSTLRPRDAIVYSVNGRSSGSVSWLHDLSELTNLVIQGGSRRGAQMIMMNVNHPDIVEFIVSKNQNPKVLRYIAQTTKSKLIREEVERKLKFEPISATEKAAYEALIHIATIEGKLNTPEIEQAKELLNDGGKYSVHNPEFLTGANISVCLTDDFMEAVENDGEYKLQFPDLENYDDEMRLIYDQEWQECGDVREWAARGYGVRTYHTIKAKELWDLINVCATYSAEPGIFFLDNANKMTNAVSYGQKVVATNPCGEQPLAPFSVCNLAAVNLAEMTENGKVNWEKLKRTVQIGTRMQDNVIDATPYFLEENTKQAKGERRIGLGVMGLHDLLIRCGLVYGSEAGNKLVDQIFEVIATTAYKTSIELAEEKGEFPFLSTFEDGRERFINSGYMKKMPEEIREAVLESGIRNSHLLTIAPTGSTGTMMNVSTGLEPYFNFVYFRSGRLGKFIPVVADIALEWLEANGYEVTEENVYEMIEHLPEQFVGTMDLSPEAHADVQCIIQRWIDSSISKTVNAPKGYSVEQVAKVYERLHKGGAKGGTVYVDGSRDAQVLSLTNEENDFTNVELETIENRNDATTNGTDETAQVKTGNVGVENGDTCPICLAGTVVEHGGCNTCDNCQVQLKCGI
ncbi:vitamin B12-dependent ribonucleotide reductase [Gottfriedia acidiceleris]|uniref:vitamin B12-dependent ribonucleotide reductase n=1 Tax=Gottfriedia acidiceleris TaxID=371036 RepID=UPI002FFF0D86